MNTEIRGQFLPEQVEQLLQPIRKTRVLSDAKGHSHVSQQDITAHLIRMFGFGNFDIEVVDRECLFEESTAKTNRAGKDYTAWDVAYRALVRLTVRNSQGEKVAFYENGSVGSAQSQPSRADAHDLAYKSAISLSIKRAAIALGDQFGLSLYNKGQLTPLVIRTMVGVPTQETDLQAGVPQQVSLGNDEIEHTDTEMVNTKTGEIVSRDWFTEISKLKTVATARKMWVEAEKLKAGAAVLTAIEQKVASLEPASS